MHHVPTSLVDQIISQVLLHTTWSIASCKHLHPASSSQTASVLTWAVMSQYCATVDCFDMLENSTVEKYCDKCKSYGTPISSAQEFAHQHASSMDRPTDFDSELTRIPAAQSEFAYGRNEALSQVSLCCMPSATCSWVSLQEKLHLRRLASKGMRLLEVYQWLPSPSENFDLANSQLSKSKKRPQSFTRVAIVAQSEVLMSCGL